MKNLIVLKLLFVLAIHSLHAHNPLTARFELHGTLEKGAMLHTYLTQVGVHQALVKEYPSTNWENVSTDEYKSKIVKYLRDHIFIEADGAALTLGKAAIKLGDHQTEVKFYIADYYLETEELHVHVNAFAENGNQQSVFWWYTPVKTSKTILSRNINFKKVLFKSKIEDGGLNLSSWKVLLSFMVVFFLVGVCGYYYTHIIRSLWTRA